MEHTRAATHSRGYPLILEEVVDAVDVGHGLHLPDELQRLCAVISMRSVALCLLESYSTGMMERWI
jgi:hypothetical protein